MTTVRFNVGTVAPRPSDRMRLSPSILASLFGPGQHLPCTLTLSARVGDDGEGDGEAGRNRTPRALRCQPSDLGLSAHNLRLGCLELLICFQGKNSYFQNRERY